MSIQLSQLADSLSEQEVMMIADILEDSAKKDTLPRSQKQRILSQVSRKAGITMKEQKTNLRKKITVTAAILAAAALTVTATAKIRDVSLTKEEHDEMINVQYGDNAASKLDEKGLIPDNEKICDHLKITQELGACDGRQAEFFITIEAIDDIGLEKMRNTANYDFDLVPVDPENDLFTEQGWGRGKRIADDRYESFDFTVETKTAEPIKLIVKAYELFVPDEGISERGEYLGEIEVELNKNLESYDFIRDDGVKAKLTDMSLEIEDEVEISKETLDGTTDSFTQDDWDNWNNEVIFTVTMNDGSKQEYTRTQVSGSGSIKDGQSQYFFGEIILDAKDVESFEFMGKRYTIDK